MEDSVVVTAFWYARRRGNSSLQEVVEEIEDEEGKRILSIVKFTNFTNKI